MFRSPYPWHYTLRWPLYYRWPSTRNHGGMKPVPDQYQFTHQSTETLRLLFGGDIMVQNKDQVPQLHPELCELIHSADLFIANCEAPLGDHPPDKQIKYGFIFNMPYSYLENIIQQTGLSPARWILSTANNHIGDLNYAAYLKTYQLLDNLGVKYVGRYHPELPLSIFHYKGLTLGFAAWTDWLNQDIFPSEDPGIFRTKHMLSHHWRTIKHKYKLDYLFGMPHWEYEFQHYPHKCTQQLAKSLINSGMDFIVGAHTHTLQAMEWFTNGFCAYNLGNFCGFAGATSVKLIPLLEIRLNLNRAAPTYLQSYQFHYFFQQVMHDKVVILPLHLAPHAERQKITRLITKLFDSPSLKTLSN